MELNWVALLEVIANTDKGIRVEDGLLHVIQKKVERELLRREYEEWEQAAGMQEGTETGNKGIRLASRKPCFSAVTLSTSERFQKEHGESSYADMKTLFDKLLKALYAFCRRLQIVCVIWYRCVVQDGHPHIHGVLVADSKQAQKELARLWSKYGLGYGTFKNKRQRGNVCFRDIFDLAGWLKYCHCRFNRFGTGMKRRLSYHGRKILEGLSPFDFEGEWKRDKFSTLLKRVRLDVARV